MPEVARSSLRRLNITLHGSLADAEMQDVAPSSQVNMAIEFYTAFGGVYIASIGILLA
jgi:hypothetical protein